MNTLIEFSRAIRIFKSRYPIYLLILIIGFLLQRSVLIDIPMNNDEGRLPLKITNIKAFLFKIFDVFVVLSYFFVFHYNNYYHKW